MSVELLPAGGQSAVPPSGARFAPVAPPVAPSVSQPAAPAVPPGEYAARIAALRRAMRGRGLDAVALASPENVHYLLGLDHLGHFAFTLLVLPRSGPPVLVARRMERHTLRAQVPHVRHALYGDGSDPARVAAGELRRVCPPSGAVGVEEQSMAFPPAVLARIRAALPELRWADCSALPARLRRVKSPAETALVRQAAEVSRAAMRAALGVVGAGVSERAVAAEAQRAMIEAGGQQPGFVPLIRSTSRLAQEHVTWSEHRLAPGEGLFVELSGCVGRYHAPMSRTVRCGDGCGDGRREPQTEGAGDAEAAAVAGLRAARSALRPGVRTGTVYAAWADAVAAHAGRRPRRHHCGYLTGAGFPPSWVGGGSVLGIRAGGRTRVRTGMVFHLMSWVDGPVGHVVSDTALVTDEGCELLTTDGAYEEDGMHETDEADGA